jgi:hypothetical protein
MENKKYYHAFGKLPNNGSKITMRGSTLREMRRSEDPTFDFIHSGEQFRSAINSSLKLPNDKWKRATQRGLKEAV